MTRREFYALFLLLFALVTVALVGVANEIRQGHARDRAIQESRTQACSSIYGSIEDVALFFFPPPKLRDARQRRIAQNLHVFTDQRINRCLRQIRGATKGER